MFAKIRSALVFLVTIGVVFGLGSSYAWAHCDTLDGPVVTAARAALEKGDPTPVLKWVQPQAEAEIRAAFQKTLIVRAKGPEARELADMYFFETLVRIHRAGEGAPYTGLKPAGTDPGPAVAAADQALADGNVDRVIRLVNDTTAGGIRAAYTRVAEAKQHAEESVEAGRAFVAAYVNYVHYVEGLHALAERSAIHHADVADAAAAHGHDPAVAEAPGCPHAAAEK